MSSSRFMKSLTSLASRIGWIGKVLHSHGLGLVFAFLVRLSDSFHPRQVLFLQGGADGFFIQNAVELLEECFGITDNSKINRPVTSDFIGCYVHLNEFC